MFGGKKGGVGDKFGAFGDKVGSFWRQHILRKKNGADKSSSSERPLTSEEKNRLAAQVATDQLGLDQAAREQVAKAIEAEMKRRHEERERRRKELMEATQVQLPWGPKRAAAAPAPEPEPQKPKQAPKISMGASIYPIKLELVKGGKGAKRAEGNIVADIDTWDDSAWKPVAATGPIGPTLEEKRKAWLSKHSMTDTSTRKAMAPKQASSPKSASLSDRGAKSPVSSASEFGAQPAAIQIDEEAVKEIHAHTLGMMLQNILVQAQETQGKSPKSGKSSMQLKSMKSSKSPPSKKPSDMTPDELVELLKRDPEGWDRFTTQNTVISFGMTTPTPQDVDKAKKTKGAKRENKVTFDDKIDVAKAPVGRDFTFNERLDRSTGTLKK